tara:strand:- start:10 stop:330 length:321 start_codon:yes stop_codon:yes gene_type:complete
LRRLLRPRFDALPRTTLQGTLQGTAAASTTADLKITFNIATLASVTGIEVNELAQHVATRVGLTHVERDALASRTAWTPAVELLRMRMRCVFSLNLSLSLSFCFES